MNVLIINHSVQNCGVYQYGKRVGSILSSSKLINFIYLEINSFAELEIKINEYKPELIIYNYLEGTLPWLNQYLVHLIRAKGIKQLNIVHNISYNFFDYSLHQNPYHKEDNFNFPLKRPLFNYTPTNIIKNNEYLNIGSFGFGFNFKHFDKICTLIDNQLGHKKVKLNLHLTKAHFSNTDDRKHIFNTCKELLKNPIHELVFTQNFLSDNDILNFLYNNDLNIFFYDNFDFYNGISSVIDYAISVKKPICICKSNMFSHILDTNPSICIEDSTLEKIIENGFNPLNNKFEEWSPDNFTEHVEKIIKKIYV